jgi:hypothetical protein
MARDQYRGEWWAYRFWPIPLLTPQWFDETPVTSRLGFVWAWMRSKGLIRLAKEPDQAADRT